MSNTDKNNIYIDGQQQTSEVDGVTNYGVRIPFTIQSLEKYGGPQGSQVYMADSSVGFNRIIFTKQSSKVE
jgi:hypothetical protein